ncbi:unnamed protein product [Peniophora sp. CBMAI 1063]|nr:unnamed protein product [Peniophora sp. CBMAI 1063]
MSSASPSTTSSAGGALISNGSGSDNGGGGGGGTSSSLYLFTFLATLLLLLCVSSAIILRSFILRRRFRRHVEEAFYAGVWAGGDVPPGFPGAGTKRPNVVGPRPVMFDAYAPSGERKAEHEKWDDVQPVSALAVLPSQPAPATPLHTSPQPASSLPPPRGLARLLPSRFINPTNAAETEMTSPTSSAPAAPTPETVQVALLVAMPDARRANAGSTSDGRTHDGDEELPELVLGVRKVDYRDTVRA